MVSTSTSWGRFFIVVGMTSDKFENPQAGIIYHSRNPLLGLQVIPVVTVTRDHLVSWSWPRWEDHQDPLHLPAAGAEPGRVYGGREPHARSESTELSLHYSKSLDSIFS